MLGLRAAIVLHAAFGALADLPVHCLRHQVAGDWEFTVGPPGAKRSSCGHRKPDSPDGQPTLDFLLAQGATTTKKFTLSDPNTVSSEDGSGTWTMIYDEGFEVAVGDTTYFAFSKFEWVQDPVKGKTNVSHCDQTMVGWYRDSARSSWGCYAGRKVGAQADSSGNAPATGDVPTEPQHRASLSSVDITNIFNLATDTSSAAAEPPTNAAPAPAESLVGEAPASYTAWHPASAGFDQPMSSDWRQGVAGALNLMQLGWKAAAYEGHRMFHGRTPRELNRNAGLRRSKPGQRYAPLPGGPESFLRVRTHLRRAATSEADSMDWRNKDGKNWLTPVVTQGDCGSCYTISTIHMLTARNRIRTQNTEAPSFSMAFPLYCSEYNQGCDGGYGFLQSKWSEDVGLVPESCAPFSEGGGSCQLSASCDLGGKRYRATNHHYVGGFYGGGGASQMKQELVQGGPLVVSFEPKEDFMYYKGGVYKSSGNQMHQEWEQVDHAVLLVGFSEDAGQPYWTCQNSWGNDWGEDGYFRMARGIDESGVEGIVVSADVVEEDSNPVLDDFIASL